MIIDTLSASNNPNYPSRTGNPSGPGRGNNPAKGKIKMDAHVQRYEGTLAFHQGLTLADNPYDKMAQEQSCPSEWEIGWRFASSIEPIMVKARKVPGVI